VIDDNEAVHLDFRKILAGPVPGSADVDAIESLLFDTAGVIETLDDYEIDSAYQGAEGLDLVRRSIYEQRPYALAFVDVRMPPGWDGIETVRRIWRECPELQVVLCTAYSDYSWKQIVQVLGKTDRLLILRKPFDNIEVRQLAQALSEKNMLAQLASHRMEDLEQAVRERTRALEDAHRELRQAQKLEAIGRLAAGIAHEINTPIQFIGSGLDFLSESIVELLPVLRAQADAEDALVGSGHVDLAARMRELRTRIDIDYLADEIPRVQTEVRTGIARIARIVRSIKTLAHPGSAEMTRVDLNELVSSILDMAANEFEYVADLHKQLGDVPPVPCDPVDISQVIVNLIVNAAHAISEAVEASQGRGTITIETYVEGNEAVVAIEDTGTGIADDIRDRIFDPFFTTKEVGQGSGQGLALAWAIVVDRHRGRLSFDSIPRQGTRFYVRLPLEHRAAVTAG
jgi:signal transduction histidine kinase